jgi:hypothetical protein
MHFSARSKFDTTATSEKYKHFLNMPQWSISRCAVECQYVVSAMERLRKYTTDVQCLRKYVFDAELNLNNTENFSPYRAVNTLRLGYTN